MHKARTCDCPSLDDNTSTLRTAMLATLTGTPNDVIALEISKRLTVPVRVIRLDSSVHRINGMSVYVYMYMRFGDSCWQYTCIRTDYVDVDKQRAIFAWLQMHARVQCIVLAVGTLYHCSDSRAMFYSCMYSSVKQSVHWCRVADSLYRLQLTCID